MNNSEILALEDVEAIYSSLLEHVTRQSVVTTLKGIHEVCSKMVSVNAMPSIPAVVKALANKGVIISEQTIYNKRQGRNPYPILIEAWIKVSMGKKLNLTGATFPQNAIHLNSKISSQGKPSLITDEDLLKIQDPVIRYKVSVLYGQLTSLKKQNSALKELRGLPSIKLDEQNSTSTQITGLSTELSEGQLDKYDIEILNNFINNQEITGLTFDKVGALLAKKAIRRESILSDPGFKNVIEKVISFNS